MEIKDAQPNYELIWIREFARHTQTEAAQILKVNRVSYTRWENGSRPTPEKAVPFYAAAIGLPLTEIPADPKAAVELDRLNKKIDEEADLFAEEVRRVMGTPSQYKAEQVIAERGLDGVVALPSITANLLPHQFRPSYMKKFNVPEERWVEFVVELPGESVEDLKLGGYSWDQAVTWKDDEAKAKAFALLKVWEEARDTHFAERYNRARAEKIAMPPMVYVRIVQLFDALLDAQGWGLV